MVYKLIIFEKSIKFDKFEDLQLYLNKLEKYCEKYCIKLIPFKIINDTSININFD